MFVIVAGGGRVGAQLASILIQAGYKTRLIENRPTALDHLHTEIPTEAIFIGDPTLPSTLDEADLASADVLAAVLSEDAHNLALSNFAKFHYHVPRVIARINDPRNGWLFTENMGVDVALSQADLIARIIQEEMSLGDMMTLLKLRRGKFSLVEEKIPEGARAINIPLQDLNLPKNCVIAAILRGDEMLVPYGMSTFQAGDEVLAITDPHGQNFLHHLFTADEKKAN